MRICLNFSISKIPITYRHRFIALIKEVLSISDANQKKHFYPKKDLIKSKKNRLEQILTALKNGLIFYPSGDNYGIVPKFIISARLKIPIPLFHSFVKISEFENSILLNEYILKENNRTFVFIYNPLNIVSNISRKKLVDNWVEFLKVLNE